MSTQPTENTTANKDTRRYECPESIVCGTEGDDSLRGTFEADNIEGLRGDDTLKGLNGDDSLYGSDSYLYDPGERGNDTLLGGQGYDHLYGEQGNDTLKGGVGGDTYRFGQGWGRDVVIDRTLPAPSDVKRNTMREPMYYSYHDRVDRVDFVLVAEDLSITLTSDSGPKPEASNASGTNTVNWDANVIETVDAGSGSDTIKGNDLANTFDLINGNPPYGADTVFGGGGDDTIYAEDGEHNDTVNCGEGTDVAQHDTGDTVADDCEHHGTVTELAPPPADTPGEEYTHPPGK
jgi:Ca2+-binding RTX toxin-like protein